MNDIAVINLSEDFTGYYQRDMPNFMAPEMMRRLLGGKFPNTGFSWEFVKYFKHEGEGLWEPHNGFNEILPAAGFIISVEVVDC